MAGMVQAVTHPRAARIVLGLFVWAGMALLALAAVSTLRTIDFLRHSEGAVGAVDRMERVVRKSTRGTPQITYAPVFSFITAHDREITVTSRSSSNPPEFHAGEEVPVLYDRRNPENARINTFGQIWGVEIMLGGMGAGVCVFCLAWSASLRRRKAAVSAN
jgi:hypothetical protein